MGQVTENLFVKMHQARLECFEYTNIAWVTYFKYYVTYILFYIPECVFFFIFSFALKGLEKENLKQFLFFHNIAKIVYPILTWPSDMILRHYINTGSYHENKRKIWFNPFVPYNTLYQYKKHCGKE